MSRSSALLAPFLVACSFSGASVESDDASEPTDGGVDSGEGSDASIPTGPFTRTFQNGPTYSDTHDTMVDSISSTAVNGENTSLQWDSDAGHWVLFRFGSIVGPDATQIPLGAEVTSAILRLETTDTSDMGNPGRIRRVLTSWDEDVSYTVFTGGGAIDAGEMDTSSFIDAPTSQGPHQFDVTADVAAWVTDPATNNGWIVEPMSTNGISMVSSEAALEDSRPSLEVTYMVR